MVLVKGKLNVVGEHHSLSNGRRELEKAFCKEMTGSSNYWVEHDFPDLHQDIPGRTTPEGQDDEEGADLMELRAAHGASMLVVKSEPLAVTADKLAKVQANVPQVLVAAFERKVQEFRQVCQRLANSWQPTRTTALNTAAQAVFTDAQNLAQAYFGASRNAQTELKAAAQTLATSLQALRNRLPALERAVSAPSGRGAQGLADHMRVQRSRFMGLAGAFSQEKGVWKIGDKHVDDLKTEKAKVDMSRANFVSEADFNHAYDAWLAEKLRQRREQLARQAQQGQQGQQQVQQNI
jgi:hypothetical protein